MMGTMIGHLSAGVVKPPTKRVVAAFFGVRHERRLPQPAIPVEVIRSGGRSKWSTHRVATECNLYPSELTDPSSMDHFHGSTEAVVTPLPTTDLHNPASSLNDFANLLAFIDCQRDRLLNIDVFSSLQSVDQHAGMPVVGSANQNYVDPTVVEESSVVLMSIDTLINRFWRKSRLLFDGGINRGEVANGAINISHSEKTTVDFGKSGNDRALIAAADHAKTEFAVLFSNGRPKCFQWPQPVQECRNCSCPGRSQHPSSRGKVVL